MIKLLGALFLVLALGGIGYSKTVELRRRPRALQALSDALCLLRTDMVNQYLPLPEALRHVSEHAGGMVAPFFRETAALKEHTVAEAWRAALPLLRFLKQEERETLAQLGAQLGRYDAAAQDAALQRCISALDAAQTSAADDAKRYGRLCTGLGFTAGAVLAVTFY